MKLDIGKAFDNVSREYLLDLMQRLGFSARWRDWVALLLLTSSSSFLINGLPGVGILQRPGLRQGDPLRLFLFILAINPLHHILVAVASNRSYISPIPGRELKLRVSLYADDAVIFVNLVRQEIEDLWAFCMTSGTPLGFA